MNTRLLTILSILTLASFSHGFATSSEKPHFVYAAWYKVPVNSLAHRRAAAPNEFTAAHNRLPLGTLVRLTNPDNDHTVVVRITDRGVPRSRASIDICKEAAQALGFLREGVIRVHMEVLSNAPAAVTAASPAELTH
jgi:rare lipoprotein A